MTLEEVRAESARVFPQLLELLEALPEDAYGDASRFPGMPAEWEPWFIIAGNTFSHYLDHTQSLKQLLEQREQGCASSRPQPGAP